MHPACLIYPVWSEQGESSRLESRIKQKPEVQSSAVSRVPYWATSNLVDFDKCESWKVFLCRSILTSSALRWVIFKLIEGHSTRMEISVTQESALHDSIGAVIHFEATSSEQKWH